MAKLPALVSALAEADGRERPTIDHIARVIREAGYIPTGKRGVGAAEMDIRSAANLLIASAVSEVPKDSPTEIDRFRSLRKHTSSWEGDTTVDADGTYRVDVNGLPPSPFDRIVEQNNFGAAFEELIEAVPELRDALIRYGDAAYKGHGKEFLELGSFGIQVKFQKYHAEIEFFVTVAEGRSSVIHITYAMDGNRPWEFYGKQQNHRRVDVTIDFHLLEAVWRGIQPER